MKRSFNPPKKRLKNEAFRARRDFSKNNTRQNRVFSGKNQNRNRTNCGIESSPVVSGNPKMIFIF